MSYKAWYHCQLAMVAELTQFGSARRITYRIISELADGASGTKASTVAMNWQSYQLSLHDASGIPYVALPPRILTKIICLALRIANHPDRKILPVIFSSSRKRSTDNIRLLIA
jgi:hypothetical protein